MFVLDNLLLGPGKAALFMFEELARKAQEDWLDDEAVKRELQEIYGLVESGQISSQEFDAREGKLLERLEQIAQAKSQDAGDPAPADQPTQPQFEVVQAVKQVLPPLPPEQPRPVAQPAAPPPPVARPPLTGGSLTINQVVDSAMQAFALLNLKLSVVTSVAPSEDGWRVTAEFVERKGVPDTNDSLGLYEVRLDPAGNVLRYERTRLRRRGDLGR